MGEALNRAEAQVLRLQTLYAVLDGSNLIRPQHLEAALAVWEYCEQSTRYILQGKFGNKLAKKLLEMFGERNQGTLTDIHGWLGRNYSGEAIREALAVLEAENHINKTTADGVDTYRIRVIR